MILNLFVNEISIGGKLEESLWNIIVDQSVILVKIVNLDLLKLTPIESIKG